VIQEQIWLPERRMGLLGELEKERAVSQREREREKTHTIQFEVLPYSFLSAARTVSND
jgi:hypothetical protein